MRSTQPKQETSSIIRVFMAPDPHGMLCAVVCLWTAPPVSAVMGQRLSHHKTQLSFGSGEDSQELWRLLLSTKTQTASLRLTAGGWPLRRPVRTRQSACMACRWPWEEGFMGVPNKHVRAACWILLILYTRQLRLGAHQGLIQAKIYSVWDPDGGLSTSPILKGDVDWGAASTLVPEKDGGQITSDGSPSASVPLQHIYWSKVSNNFSRAHWLVL